MSDTGSCACGKSESACSAPKTENKAKTTGGVIQNGKGDAPRNISETFRSNYNGIRWKTGGKLKKGERLVKVYR